MQKPKTDAENELHKKIKEVSMIVFKVLLIAALVIPLIYFAAIMMNSVMDEILPKKDKNSDKK